VNRLEIGVGKTWNYIDGRRSRGEPFINNEFGYLAAFDGDGDWSWGGLMAVNTLRSLDKLVGYTYTELTDIEWEHNGVYNYDRSPKEYGFDFWAERMSVRDLFAEDFLVLDVPAIKRASPGETVQVPILISHFSGRLREKPFTLCYRLDYIDALGNRRRGKAQRQVVVGVPDYRLTPLTVAQVQLPNEPCLATLVVWAEDWNRARIHTNYTQWLVGMEQLPAFEAQRGRVILRFKPDSYIGERVQPAEQARSPDGGQALGARARLLRVRRRHPRRRLVERRQAHPPADGGQREGGTREGGLGAASPPRRLPPNRRQKVPLARDCGTGGRAGSGVGAA
jgi:hypothetical protein